MHVRGLKRTAKNDCNFGYIFLYVKKSNEQPRSQGLNVEPEVEGPDKGWLSHDQSFQNCWKIFLPNYRVLMFCNKFGNYIGKFGHVTTRLGRVVHHMLHHKEALETRLSNKISNGFLLRKRHPRVRTTSQIHE